MSAVEKDLEAPRRPPEKLLLRDATPEQLLNLNENQLRMHAYTCPNRGDGDHREFNGDLGALVATKRGWVCPWCDYTQDWVLGLSP